MRRGIALIELMVVIACLFIVFLFGIVVTIHSYEAARDIDPNHVKESVTLWMNGLGIEGKATCDGFDTDGDGYVSCAIRDAKIGRIIAVECTGVVTFEKVCRIPKSGMGGW